MKEKYIKNMNFKEVLNFKNLIEYVEDGVESRTLVQKDDFSMTLFAFEKEEGISAYSMPGDTMIYVYEGITEVIIGENKKFIVQKGETIAIPPNILHSLSVIERAKVMIIIVKPKK